MFIEYERELRRRNSIFLFSHVQLSVDGSRGKRKVIIHENMLLRFEYIKFKMMNKSTLHHVEHIDSMNGAWELKFGLAMGGMSRSYTR